MFVVGALDETLELRGLRYHPIDIETSVSRTHRSIAEWCVSQPSLLDYDELFPYMLLDTLKKIIESKNEISYY